MHNLCTSWIFRTCKVNVIKNRFVMISLNYQLYGTKGFQLRLRFYEDGETRFINVNRNLKGCLQRKHWNQKKKCLYPSAPFYEENTKFLDGFKEKYETRLKDWRGTLAGFLISCQQEDEAPLPQAKRKLSETFQYFIDEMKRNNVNPDGTISGGYEPYEKTVKRFEEFCKEFGWYYDRLTLDDMNPQFINKFLYWVTNRGRGRCLYVSNTLHAVLRKSAKFGWYTMMNEVELCNWIRKNGKSSKKYQTLTAQQCDRFVNLSVDELPKGQNTELYRDFCTFILYTCQSACDAISLQYSDIQNINGVEHFVFKRRKIANKQSTDCSVPINDTMRKIMKRWKPMSKDGYIFPIRSKEKIAKSVTNNGDIKHFISRLNLWLKKMTPILGVPFPLHSYIFRHTGITHYISKGVPIIYVANLAGTSVSNCESIYYNNQGDTSSRDKVLGALSFK